MYYMGNPTRLQQGYRIQVCCRIAQLCYILVIMVESKGHKKPRQKEEPIYMAGLHLDLV